MRKDSRFLTDLKVSRETHPTIKVLVRTLPTRPWRYLRKPFIKPGSKQCHVKGCRNYLSRSKLKNSHTLCHRCDVRHWRINNPVKARWHSLKDRANRKKQSFEITFEQFAALCESTGYLNGVGREKGCLHLDRIDPLVGYTIENLRVITAEENSTKGAGYDKRMHEQQREDEQYDEPNPF